MKQGVPVGFLVSSTKATRVTSHGHEMRKAQNIRFLLGVALKNEAGHGRHAFMAQDGSHQLGEISSVCLLYHQRL